VDNRREVVGGQAEAAAGLVPDDELFDVPFEEGPDDEEPPPEVELDFSAGFDELDDESPELAAADLEGSDFVDDAESDDASLPAGLRLSLR